jgi:hypothetical protein
MQQSVFATLIGFLSLVLMTVMGWGASYECVQFFLTR